MSSGGGALMKPIHLRLKRTNQTLFMHCLPGEPLSELKDRTAQVLSRRSQDLLFYRFIPETERAEILRKRAEARLDKERLRKAQIAANRAQGKSRKGGKGRGRTSRSTGSSSRGKKGGSKTAEKKSSAPKKILISSDTFQPMHGKPIGSVAKKMAEKALQSNSDDDEKEMVIEERPTLTVGKGEDVIELPPLDETKTIHELGLRNDDVLFFVFRDLKSGAFEAINAEGFTKYVNESDFNVKAALAASEAKVSTGGSMGSMDFGPASPTAQSENQEATPTPAPEQEQAPESAS